MAYKVNWETTHFANNMNAYYIAAPISDHDSPNILPSGGMGWRSNCTSMASYRHAHQGTINFNSFFLLNCWIVIKQYPFIFLQSDKLNYERL